MSTDFHDAFVDGDAITIEEVEERLADLDAAIGTQVSGASSVSAAIVYDSKSTTTDGGATTGGSWDQRDLNSEVDPDGIVSVGSNRFTPVSGTYLVFAVAPAYFVDETRLRLYNHTQSSEVRLGLNKWARSGEGTMAVLKWILTANGTDAYRVDQYAEDARAQGLGLAVDDGGNETYCMVLLIKVA